MKNEIDSKALLRRYGFTTTQPMLASNAAEAAAHAAAIGKPLAMKVVSADIVHKVDAGGVRLNVSPDAAAAAYDDIMAQVSASTPGAAIDGVLLEEMVPPGLEVFIGGRIDPAFGAVVLVGYGGSGVEKGPPPAAALAPVDEAAAGRLIAAALGGRIDPANGPAGHRRLLAAVMAVAGPDGILGREAVGELDINPLIISDREATAVDAVVGELPPGLAGARRTPAEVAAQVEARRCRLGGMDALFDPQAVALVGASTVSSKLGYRIIRNMLDFGFDRPLYPIHPTADEICGTPAYPSIDAIPGPVDRAIVAVPAAQVSDVLAACTRKGVKVAQVLTAGFSEWDHDKSAGGAAREDAIRKVLAGTAMRMVGPNCMGTFSVSGRLTMGAPRYCPQETGGITFISQSGTYAGDVTRRAQVMGLPVGRVLSAGNCADLDLVDYLLHCDADPQTDVVAFYCESLNDPGLFFRVAAGMAKPVVMLKGGSTDQGHAAASSHTAALATDRALWDAAVRQAGILQVNHVDELLDALLMVSAHGRLTGNRLAIFGSGGGVSVTSSDEAARHGLTVPALDPATAAALSRFGVPGTSVGNPIDIPVWGLKEDGRYILEEIINRLKDDSNVDAIVVYVEMGSIMDFADDEADGLRQLEDLCASVTRARTGGPRVTLALRSAGDATQDDFVRRQRADLLRRGIAVFSSTSRAVRAQAGLLAMTRSVQDEPVDAGLHLAAQ